MYSAQNKGKLSIEIVEAELTHNTEMVGKMDPYVKFKYRNKEHKTRIRDNAGKHPRWNQSFIIDVQDAKNDKIQFEVLDKDTFTSSHIGDCKITIVEMTGMGPGMECWHDLWFKSKRAGKMLITTKWVDQQQATGPNGGNGALKDSIQGQTQQQMFTMMHQQNQQIQAAQHHQQQAQIQQQMQAQIQAQHQAAMGGYGGQPPVNPYAQQPGAMPGMPPIPQMPGMPAIPQMPGMAPAYPQAAAPYGQPGMPAPGMPNPYGQQPGMPPAYPQQPGYPPAYGAQNPMWQGLQHQAQAAPGMPGMPPQGPPMGQPQYPPAQPPAGQDGGFGYFDPSAPQGAPPMGQPPAYGGYGQPQPGQYPPYQQ